jgi:hypothetical protein
MTTKFPYTFPGSHDIHHLFVKRDNGKVEKILYITNIPQMYTFNDTKQILRGLFSLFGEVESVKVCDDKEGNELIENPGYAHIKYKKDSSVKKALECCNDVIPVYGEEKSVKYGIEKWKERFDNKKESAANHPTIEELEIYFDNKIKEGNFKKVEKKMGNEDSDGWILVKKKGKKSEKKEVQGKEVVDFYRFQLREQKKSKLEDLRAKFEKDKEKIANMKKLRRFKPY